MLPNSIQVFMVPVGHLSVTEAAKLCRLVTKGYADHVQLSPKLQHITPEDETIEEADPKAVVALTPLIADAMAVQEAIRNLFISFCPSGSPSSSILKLSAFAEAAMKALPKRFTIRYNDADADLTIVAVEQLTQYQPAHWIKDDQSTMFIRPGHLTPIVQVDNEGGTFTVCPDDSVNGSTKSPFALCLWDEFLGSQHQPGKAFPIASGISVPSLIGSKIAIRLGTLMPLAIGNALPGWCCEPKNSSHKRSAKGDLLLPLTLSSEHGSESTQALLFHVNTCASTWI